MSSMLSETDEVYVSTITTNLTTPEILETSVCAAASTEDQGRSCNNSALRQSETERHIQALCVKGTPFISASLSEEDIIKCLWTNCSKSFPHLDDLVNHVNDEHVKTGKETDYTCHWEGCARKGKAFNARYKMLIHIRTHTNEKPHKCCECGKSFSRLENLKIHNRSHTGEKPYLCPVEGCNKAYSNSSDRFKHTRTHFVDKPYICKRDGCNKRYTDPSSLRKHMKTYGHYREDKDLTLSCASGVEQGINFDSDKTGLNFVDIKQLPFALVTQPVINGRTVSAAAPMLAVSVASLLSNTKLSSAVDLKTEILNNKCEKYNTDRTFVVVPGINPSSTVDMKLSPEERKNQLGPLDLTINNHDGFSNSNINSTTGIFS